MGKYVSKKPTPFWTPASVRVAALLWAPDGRHPDPAAGAPVAAAVVGAARERARVERETVGKRAAASSAGGLAKKRAELESGLAERAGDETAQHEFEERVLRKEHKSAALCAHKKEKADAGMRSRKLRIYPTLAQKAIIADWLEATRITKNVIVEQINESHNYEISHLRQRVTLADGPTHHDHLPARLRSVPRDVIDQAIRDCAKDCTTRLAQLKAATRRRVYRTHFRAMRIRGDDELVRKEHKVIEAEIKREVGRIKATWKFAFRNKHEPRESMMLSRRFLNRTRPEPKTRGFAELFGGPTNRMVMVTEADVRDAATGARIGSGLPVEFYSDCRLVHEKATGTYFMCVPNAMSVHITAPRPRVPVVISIDPGVRTFATCYNPTAGTFTEHGRSGPFEAVGRTTRTTTTRWKADCRTWGVGASITFLKRKAARVEVRAAADRAKAERAAARPGAPELEHRAAVRERRKLVRKARRKRRAAARIRKRSRDLVADMHWRLAVELCRTADLILLPDFRPSNKVPKVDPTGRLRRLGKNTVTRMLGQAHAMFKARLQSKAEEYGVRVEIVREDYTSKTCGTCGHIWNDLHSQHVFRCPTCGWTLGRDMNGARNVLIRHIADSGLRIN